MGTARHCFGRIAPAAGLVTVLLLMLAPAGMLTPSDALASHGHYGCCDSVDETTWWNKKISFESYTVYGDGLWHAVNNWPVC